jgi:hypothetical protein
MQINFLEKVEKGENLGFFLSSLMQSKFFEKVERGENIDFFKCTNTMDELTKNQRGFFKIFQIKLGFWRTVEKV